MAMNNSTAKVALRPRWPEDPFKPTRAYVHYGPIADELVVYFADSPVPCYSSPIDAPEGDDAAVLVGLGPDDEAGQVVGIHVYPMLAGAGKAHPEWRRLAEPDPPPSLLARFVRDVEDLFRRYWTPPPLLEEQLARLTCARPQEDTAREDPADQTTGPA